MAKTIFNLEALVCVEVVNKKRCVYLKYARQSKFIFVFTEEGFYDLFGSGPYSKEEVEQGKYHNTRLLVFQNEVYYKPYVKLTFAGGKEKVKEFSNYEDAKKYGEEMAEKYITQKLEF